MAASAIAQQLTLAHTRRGVGAEISSGGRPERSEPAALEVRRRFQSRGGGARRTLDGWSSSPWSQKPPGLHVERRTDLGDGPQVRGSFALDDRVDRSAGGAQPLRKLGPGQPRALHRRLDVRAEGGQERLGLFVHLPTVAQAPPVYLFRYARAGANRGRSTMSEPKTRESETLTQNLSARDVAALLLVGVGVVLAIAVQARGVATFAAWLAIFGGLAVGLATKSAVVRFGGAFIVSLVLVTAIAAVVRRGDGDSAPPLDHARPQANQENGPSQVGPGEPTGDAVPPSPAEVARQLGGGAKEAAQIERIAAFYGVGPQTVGDQAAKAADLCLHGVDAGSKPSEAIALAAAGLLFVEKTTRDTARELDQKRVRELLPLTEAFVTFVATGCSR